MALYIIMRSGQKNKEISWHVGQARPISPRETYNVVEVQADGHELEKIKKECTNIPMANARVMNWFGDDAKFIVANIVKP